MERQDTLVDGLSSTALTESFPSRPASMKYGLKLLYEPAHSIVDIVFIHGIMGDREKTWTARGASRPWPESLLPNVIPEARILTYGYYAKAVDFDEMVSNSRLSHHAKNFLAALAIDREGTDAVDRPIIFVAHSMGGLLVKDALVSSKSNAERYLRKIQACTYGILFLSTPHIGSSFASWAARLAKSMNLIKRTNSDIIEVLREDSEVLERIQSEFSNMLRRDGEDGQKPIQITCFYEEIPTDILRDVVVTRASAAIPGYESIGIHADHRDMARFSSEVDPGFVSIAGELRRWLDEIRSYQVSDPVCNTSPLPRGEANNGASVCAGQITIYGNVTKSSIVGGAQIVNGAITFS